MATVGRKFLDTLTPAPVLTIAMMSICLYSTSDLILSYQNWHHIYTLVPQEEQGLSNDIQNRVIGSMEPEICTKILRK